MTDNIYVTSTSGGLDITLSFSHPYGPRITVFQAHHNDLLIGHLMVETQDEKTWVIADIQVKNAFTRKGVATELYEYAIEKLGDVEHSFCITPEGMNWASAVGGFVPTSETTTFDPVVFSLHHS